MKLNEIYPGAKLIRSDRRTLSIQITGEGQLIIRAPRRMAETEIVRFVESRREWIAAHMTAAEERHKDTAQPLTQEEIHSLKLMAAEDMSRRVLRLAPMVGVEFGRITIRCQASRWGSCSVKRNLNFNCLLMLAPEEVRDYVAAHELCHILELNHSQRFWAQVERVMPDYRAHRKWLKDNGAAIMQRVSKDE